MKANKSQIEQAYDFLEAMFSEYPNGLRKSGYVEKMQTWELSFEQLKKFTSAVTDAFDELPSIKILSDFRLTMFSVGAKHAEDAEMKAEADRCYNDHVRGLCDNLRGKQAFCKSCDGRNYPGVRPETMSDGFAIVKQFKGEELNQKLAEHETRMKNEAKEDLRKFETRRGCTGEPVKLELVK